jgi:hypothetical protein
MDQKVLMLFFFLLNTSRYILQIINSTSHHHPSHLSSPLPLTNKEVSLGWYAEGGVKRDCEIKDREVIG